MSGFAFSKKWVPLACSHPSRGSWHASKDAELKEKRTMRISLKNGRFCEGSLKPKRRCQKRVKPLSKLNLDFGLAKAKSAVEFREGS
jgi:hypothetical protein